MITRLELAQNEKSRSMSTCTAIGAVVFLEVVCRQQRCAELTTNTTRRKLTTRETTRTTTRRGQREIAGGSVPLVTQPCEQCARMFIICGFSLFLRLLTSQKSRHFVTDTFESSNMLHMSLAAFFLFSLASCEFGLQRLHSLADPPQKVAKIALQPKLTVW